MASHKRVRRRKPLSMRLAPKSERLVVRLAAVLAFRELSYVDRQAFRTKAVELLELLKCVEP